MEQFSMASAIAGGERVHPLPPGMNREHLFASRSPMGKVLFKRLFI
jgi:hypothetical protein